MRRRTCRAAKGELRQAEALKVARMQDGLLIQ